MIKKSLSLTIGMVFCCAILFSQKIIDQAKSYLLDHKDEWGLSTKDIRQMGVSNHYLSQHNGVYHVYFIQKFNELEVTGSILGVHLNESGEVLYTTSTFVQDLAEKVVATQPILNRKQALFKVLDILEITPNQPLTILQEKTNQTLFDKNSISNHDIPVELCYYPDRKTGQVNLAWKIDVDEVNQPDFWNFYIDATTGQLIAKNNYTLYCSFSSEHNHHDDEPCEDLDLPELKPTIESPALVDGSRFNVFPFLVESPIHGNRTIIEDPADPFASPFGWQDTNGMPGVDLTITLGNNVHAFLDTLDEDFSQGDEPDAGESLNFDFPFDRDAEPRSNREASVTQLYYLNNIMHDFTYHYGFDEAAGNFQYNNYDRGGFDDDYVLAQAQDGGSFNNANFTTPRDGFNGRMQMYIWDASGIGFLEVLEPEEIAQRLPSRLASFGPRLDDTPIEGEVVLAQDSTGNSSFLCDPALNSDQFEGKVVMADRGLCFFETKVQNAEKAGAIAVIVCNVEERIFEMGSSPEVEDPTIPSVMIKQSDCQQLKLLLSAGVKVKLQVPEIDGPAELDASFDNGIIAHEYGHGVSTRLTGGPSQSGCLVNDEEMGEGWSDFFTLVMSTHPDRNNPEDPRGIGNYVRRFSTDGPGIRRQPYSTDFAINNQTYDDIIVGSTAPHPVGEVWAATLWDLYWAMIDRYGWDDDIYSGSGGNNRAVQLVMDGLKLQPCNPGFVDGRDAILNADRINYGGENECLIWEVFARRGLGVDADQGESFDRRDGTPSFDIPISCSNDLIIQKSVTETINPGDTITVKILLANFKGSPIDNMVIRDAISPDLELIPNSETTNLIGTQVSSVTSESGQLSFRLDGTLAPEEFLEFTYQLSTKPELGSNRIFFDGAEASFDQMNTESLEGNGEWLIIDSLDVFDEANQWFIATTTEESDQALQTAFPLVIDGNQPALRFYHKYITEPNFDGGIVQYSRDGINWELFEDEQFFRNPYRGEIAYSAFIIPNANGFWGNAEAFRDTYIDLSRYIGEELYFRFRFSNQTQSVPDEGLGWVIDNIEVMDLLNYNSETCVEFNNGDSNCIMLENRGTVVNSSTMIVSDLDVDEVRFPFSHLNPLSKPGHRRWIYG